MFVFLRSVGDLDLSRPMLIMWVDVSFGAMCHECNSDGIHGGLSDVLANLIIDQRIDLLHVVFTDQGAEACPNEFQNQFAIGDLRCVCSVGVGSAGSGSRKPMAKMHIGLSFGL